MEFVRRYPTAAYIVLTYAFSWTCWSVFQRNYLDGNVWALPGLMLGLFGPGLIGILLAAVLTPGPRETRPTLPALAFVAAWIPATALITLDQVLDEGRAIVWPTIAASAAAALAPAFVVACAFSGRPGVRRHLRSLVRPRGAPGYYLLALALFGGIWGLGIPLSRALGLPVPARSFPPAAGTVGVVAAVALTFCYTFLPNALSEEVGWRGFALPRLQARHNPLVASVVLWFFWAIWHAPAYFGGFEAQSLEDTITEWVLMLPVAVLFTWFYNRTDGSIAVTAVLHPAMNTATRYLPVTLGGVILLAAVAAAAVARDRMWRRVASTRPSAGGG